MKTEKKIVVLPFSDEGDSPLFWDKTLAVEISKEVVADIRRMSEDCKQRGYADISKDMPLSCWMIDADPADIDTYQTENPVSGRDPNHLIAHFGDLRNHYGMADYPTVSADVCGNVYFDFAFSKVAGEGGAQVRLKDLLEMFPDLPEDDPMISREDFMSFWRSNKMDSVLTASDRMEIFKSAPSGSSDLTKEVLDELLSDYGVEGIRIIDTSFRHTLDMVLGKTDKVHYRYAFDSVEEKDAFLHGMDEVFGYEDYEIVDFKDFDEDTGYTVKEIPARKNLNQKRLAENNMLFRVGDFVEIAEPQDEEHEAFLNNFQGDFYVVAEVKEESETYLLKHPLAYAASKKGYITHRGIPAYFTDSDLTLIPEETFRMDMVIPLTGRFKPSLSYEEIISLLERPYISVPEKDANTLLRAVSCGLDRKRTDFVLYRGKVCTFGDADGGKALMPIRESVSMENVAVGFSLGISLPASTSSEGDGNAHL